MADFEQYKEHIEHTFNAYCRIVIRQVAQWTAKAFPVPSVEYGRFVCIAQYKHDIDAFAADGDIGRAE